MRGIARILADLDALASSINDVGLLAPVVILEDGTLVAGHRRLEACRKLGWSTVPVRRVRQINDAVTVLKAERDENTCRLDFAPSEAVALGMALEEMERPKAKGRKAKGQVAGGKARHGQLGGDSTPSSTPGKTRDIVAPVVGMKPSRYAHAKTVVTAQDDPDPEVARVAADAVEAMDRTGKVETAYRNVIAVRKDQPTNGSSPKPPPVGRQHRRRKANSTRRRAMDATHNMVVSYCECLVELDLPDELTDAERGTEVERLERARRALGRHIKNLKGAN